MSKKPTRMPQQRKAAVNPLMSKLLQQGGVKVQSKPNPQAEQAVQQRLAQLRNIEQQRGMPAALAEAESSLKTYPNHAALSAYTQALRDKVRRLKNDIAQIENQSGYAQQPDSLIRAAGLYHELKQNDQAAALADKALALQVDNVAALSLRALLHIDAGQFDVAAERYQRAFDIAPSDELAFELGVLYRRKIQNLPQADKWFRQVLALNPKHVNALGNWAFIQNYLVPYDAARIARETIAYAEACSKAFNVQLPPVAAANPDKKLRIGIVTADMKGFHPVGYFLDGLLNSAAVKQFDWSAYLTTAADDDFTRRVRPLFSHWHAIDAWNDDKVRAQIRADGVDILIDLSGYTGQTNRAGIFMGQAAPVQLQWLGWFATLGLPHVQGVIADPYCVPPEEEALYSEKVYRMPSTRLNMSPPKVNAPVAPPPAVKNGYMTFGCYQNPSKISDDVLAVWAHIAQKLPDARWHFRNIVNAPGTPSQIRFQQKLVSLGFNAKNLQFFPPVSREQYLKSHNAVDLILDTFPYPGGTTTTDALFMAVPTVTLALPGMIARQGEQLMSAAGLAEFVCQTKDEYIEKALYWADEKNRAKLTALRAQMRDQVLTSPVFDSKTFSEDWCKLIREIWRDQCSL
ncbi:O-linked N-acetylglucosamine transferase family protein [Neisseria perflava]|uniref:O-linked N-acetylglucosamine transferase, SPINDLY family protein n=1 Tax=Neisseria perflava TaxID=33053 RepID=UPI00209F9B7B|nr:hypothetical protein [Neisseria perflava]MCP1659285.1 putative O-linked N-acetylglucosamine transferase (SPINDLY family) [Neisseria perflava]